MKFTRLRSRNQILHTDSSTPSHQRDKAVGDKRRKVQFIAVGAADRPSPARSFPGLVGIEAIHDPETSCWTVCSNPGDLGAHLVREAAARTRYYAPVRRRGRVEMMARIDPTPLTDHTVSFHPAHSDLIADLTARGEGQDLPRKLMSHFIEAAVLLFAGRRYVLGAALHVDTDDTHLGLQVSRNGPNGRLGDAGMDLVGPWMVAVDRQIRCGAEINKGKRRQYDRAMANFRRRTVLTPSRSTLSLHARST